MPAYATIQDIIDRYDKDELLLVADNSDGTLNEKAVNNALIDMTEEIDLYIGKIHELPLPNVPTVLMRLCVNMTLYQLGMDAHGNTEEKRKRYEDALRLLKQIAKGDVKLGITDPSAADAGDGSDETSASEGVEFSSAPRLFSRASLRGVM